MCVDIAPWHCKWYLISLFFKVLYRSYKIQYCDHTTPHTVSPVTSSLRFNLSSAHTNPLHPSTSTHTHTRTHQPISSTHVLQHTPVRCVVYVCVCIYIGVYYILCVPAERDSPLGPGDVSPHGRDHLRHQRQHCLHRTAGLTASLWSD